MLMLIWTDVLVVVVALTGVGLTKAIAGGVKSATIVNILTCSPAYHPSDEKREALIKQISSSLEDLGDWAITACVLAGIHKKNPELAEQLKNA